MKNHFRIENLPNPTNVFPTDSQKAASNFFADTIFTIQV